MRVTNNLINHNLLYNIQNNMQKQARTQEQISTGKKILRPSDNPADIAPLMATKATLDVNEQYVKNIDDGLSYLYTTDSTLGSVEEVLDGVEELAVQGANGTLGEEDMAAVGEQVDKIVDNVVDLANTTVSGKYIFAGRENDQPPFIRDGDTIYYRGGYVRDSSADTFDQTTDDDGRVSREIGPQALYQVDAAGVTKKEAGATPGVFGNIYGDRDNPDATYDGEDVYKVTSSDPSKEADSIFNVLFGLRDALNNGDADKVNEYIDKVQDQIDHTLKHRVGIGARTRHFESAKDQLADQEVNVTQMMQNLEDTDVAKLSIELAQQNLTYQASLASSSKIMQTSLLNFL